MKLIIFLNNSQLWKSPSFILSFAPKTIKKKTYQLIIKKKRVKKNDKKLLGFIDNGPGMDTKKSLGLLLRSLRRNKNMSQKALAEKSGLSDRFIISVEKGISQPSVESFFLLCKGLDEDPGDIINKLNKEY